MLFIKSFHTAFKCFSFVLLSSNQVHKKAFEELFKQFAPNLVLFATTYMKDQAMAEGIVQDCFINIWAKRNEIELNEKLKSYLYTTVKNTCLNSLSKRKVETSPMEYHDYNTAISNADPLQQLTQKETELKIAAAIDQLPPKCKRVFLLSRNEEMSYKEIASFLEVSIKTVENQMGYALKSIRQSLGMKKNKDSKGYYLPSILFLIP